MATQVPALDALCNDLSNLQQLARQGSWRSLIEAISQARKLSLPLYPHEQLVHHAYLVLAHMKLRSYGDASLELDALADLDSPQYQYQHYPNVYPEQTGSMVPFALRWLHAELPSRLNQPALTIDRLYSLYDHCQQRIERLQASDDSAAMQAASSLSEYADHSSIGNVMGESILSSDRASNADPERTTNHQAHSEDGNKEAEKGTIKEIKPASGVDTAESGTSDQFDEANPDQFDEAKPDSEFGEFISGMGAAINDLEESSPEAKFTFNPTLNVLKCWQQRQEFIISCIVSHHLNQRDFVIVLKWFKELLKRRPSDPWLLSKLGYVQMQMGDLMGASYTFSEVEKAATTTTAANFLHSDSQKGLVSCNKGLEHMVLKQYTDAIKEFDKAIEMNPVDINSANNKALSCMYSRDLIGSTKVLERILDKVPLLALNESLVLNLCSMYELAFVHNVQTKKNLSDWIQQIAPGDFDFSCTRL